MTIHVARALLIAVLAAAPAAGQMKWMAESYRLMGMQERLKADDPSVLRSCRSKTVSPIGVSA